MNKLDQRLFRAEGVGRVSNVQWSNSVRTYYTYRTRYLVGIYIVTLENRNINPRNTRIMICLNATPLSHLIINSILRKQSISHLFFVNAVIHTSIFFIVYPKYNSLYLMFRRINYHFMSL